MELNTCKTCGGAVLREGNYYVCEACGNRWMINAADDVRAVQRANAWEALRQSDFEKATELFEEILVKDENDHEAHWGRALAWNGIQYVTDYSEHKKVPTCNNITEESFLQNKNVQKAVALAPEDVKKTYQQQAEQIEKIRVEWLKKARKEAPYDIFISYKDSDREHGIERTQDSIDAQDLYNALLAEGYKVFFSRISLLNKVSEQYEPYIYNALKTAKVMIVFGEKPEYFNAVWVKNEWGRFKARIEKGEKHPSSLVVVYKNMDPNDLPAVLKSRQCLNAQEMTFLPLLLKHVQNVIAETNKGKRLDKIAIKGGAIAKKSAQIQQETLQTREIANEMSDMTNVSDEQLLVLAHSYLGSKQWAEATKILEGLLLKNPNYAEAVLCSLYTKYHCPNVEEMLLQIDAFKQEDFATLERTLNCAGKPFAEELLEKLYMVGEFSQEATYEKLLTMILPYNFDKRSERIEAAFNTAIERAHFNVFNILLKTLDVNDVDGYIRYNLAFAESTKVAQHKMTCMKNVLGVDMGNVGALKVLLDLQLVSEEMPVIMKTFEEMLKYSPDTDEAIRELFVSFAKKLDSLEHCVIVKEALRYYQGDLANIKTELLDLGFHMISKGFFEPAQYLLTQVRLVDSENVRAYWGLCLSKLHVKSEEEIGNAGVQLNDLPEYSKYLLLVSPERREECLKFTRSQRKYKIKKRWAFVLAVVAMFALGSTLSVVVKEQIDLRKRGFCVMVQTGDYYTVMGVERDGTEFVIPAEYNGLPVKAISSSAFEGQREMQSITIPNSVTEIGAYAFYSCKALKTIDLPDNLTKLGEAAFQFSGLTEIELPNTLKEIPNEVFAKTPLTKVTLPNALEEIGDKAFSETALTEIVIPDTLESIAPTALNGCAIKTASLPSFATVVLPRGELETVTITSCDASQSIPANAFNGCSLLTTVNMPDDVLMIGENAFRGCKNLMSIDIPDGVVTVDASAFEDCSSLYSLHLPESIITIGEYAFRDCEALSSVYIPATVSYVGVGAFAECENISSVTLPTLALPSLNKYNLRSVTINAGKEISGYEFYDLYNLYSVTLADSVTTIGEYAFAGCENLTNVNLGDGVDTIGDYAFRESQSLSTIDLGANAREIGNYAFYKCTALETVTMGENLATIGECAFEGSGITSIAIPSSVTAMGIEAFKDCVSLTEANVNASVISKGAFMNCEMLTTVTFGENVIEISESAFEGTALTAVVLPNGLKTIGKRAFADIDELTSVTIPDGVESVASDAFEGSFHVESVTAPMHVVADISECVDPKRVVITSGTVMEEGILSHNANLQSVTLPNGLTNIAVSAFAYCRNLTDVVLPDSVTEIGNSAFNCCEALAELVIPSGVTSIANAAFEECISLKEVVVPESVTTLGDRVWYFCGALEKVTILGTPVQVGRDLFGQSNAIKEATVPANMLPQIWDTSLETVVVTSGETIAAEALHSAQKLTSVTLPDTITSIGDGAFAYCKALTEITVHGGVIGADAFNGCENLTTITLGKDVTEIGNSAFEGCLKLETVYYQGTVDDWCKITFISYDSNPLVYGAKLYIDNELVTEITVTDAATNIGAHAFNGYSALTSVTVLAGVTKIGKEAFAECVNLMNAEIHAAEIGSVAFQNCDALETLTLGDEVIIIGDGAFASCEALAEVTIPNSVTKIEAQAFRYCGKLTEIVIPDSVTELGDYAFRGVKSVSLSADLLPKIEREDVETLTVTSGKRIEAYTFASSTSLTTLILGVEVKEIGFYAFKNCQKLTTVVIESKETVMETGAFSGCNNIVTATIANANASFLLSPSKDKLESVVINGNISNAFQNCTNLKSVVIGEDVTAIQHNAFENCVKLSNITIGDNVTSIGSKAFDNTAYYNKEDNWENGVLYIGKYLIKANPTLSGEYTVKEGTLCIADNAFADCTELTGVTIPDSVKSIGYEAFENCTALENITIGNSVERIYEYAFNNTAYYNNEENWEDNVLYIGKYLIRAKTNITGEYTVKAGTLCLADYAFYSCDELTGIVLPDGLTQISYQAFADCYNLVRAVIPASVQKIGESAFSSCHKLTDVTIPDGVTEIDGFVFYKCYALTQINIPESVTKIGWDAFYQSGLTSLLLHDKITAIEGNAFNDCKGLTKVTIPLSVTKMDQGAFSNCDNLTIYCEAEEKPEGWNDSWAQNVRAISWGN